MHDGGRNERESAEIPADVLVRLWRESSGERFGFGYEQFSALMLKISAANGWSARDIEQLPPGRVREVVLARACASGSEAAWEAFLTEYREMLYSAAYSISRQDAQGRELADSLYAELFGISAHGEQRRPKLALYTGKGSLAGWLRTVLAQRYVDEYRRSRRLVSIEDQDAQLLTATPASSATNEDDHRTALADSIGAAFTQLGAEERFLLSAYHLDGRNLAEIAELLGVHESTISRKLKRLTENLRKQVFRHLQSAGLSRRAAEEALSANVGEIDVDVRRLLQVAGSGPFHREKAMEVQSPISAGEES